MAAELKRRSWLGIEIGPTDDIIRRFAEAKQDSTILADQRKELNALFPDRVRRIRERTGWWTCESIREQDARKTQTTLNLE
jgi:site-specific DNA-methyltransferase (adenine-specific)